MVFRYSLKWLLAAMVYAAVAAAAFSQPTWVYADLLWIATLAAFGYALLLLCFARATSQARGGGFAMLAAAFVICAYFAPDSVPTTRLLNAMGISNSLQVNVAVPPPATMATGTYSSGTTWALVAPSTSAGSYNLRTAAPAPQGNMFSAQGDPHWSAKLRAANAVGTMTIGLVGCLLASVAMRKRRGNEVAKTVLAVAAILPAVLEPGAVAQAAGAPSITYVDATEGAAGNTRLASGDEFRALNASPVGNDNQWTLRPFGNGGTVFTANDGLPPGPEDAPGLVTTIAGLTPGASYNLYAFFWSDHHNWHLQASLNPPDDPASNPSGYRPSKETRAKPALVKNFASTVLVEDANRVLQQASLGRATADSRGEIQVWIDDLANAVSANRTWYDGVGYALAPRPSSLWPMDSAIVRWLLAALLMLILAAIVLAYSVRRLKASRHIQTD